MTGACGRARALFERRVGRAPEAVAFAPGRINLIGDHTDYQGGLSLPIAIRAGIAAAAARRDDGRWRLLSEGRGESAWLEVSPLRRLGPAAAPEGWARLLVGALAEAGVGEGVDLALAADLPEGSGLSSSAAAALAALAASLAALGRPVRRATLAEAAQRAENRWCQVPSGRMDQLAIVFARAGQAVRVDSASFTVRRVPFAPEADGYRLWRIDVGARRLVAASGYAARRQESEAAARALGLDSLRAATMTQVDGAGLGPPLDRRARHIVSENARVDAVLEAAAAHDWVRVGRLLSESHASLRDDYESSHPLLDRVVAALLRLRPAVGARVTGGGFGGSLVALGEAGQEAAVGTTVARVAGAEARWEAVTASAGLGWRRLGPGPRAPAGDGAQAAGSGTAKENAGNGTGEGSG